LQRVMIFPYDDRGMDVVGPNTDLLLQLYRHHHAYLLDYNRPVMDTTLTKHATWFLFWIEPDTEIDRLLWVDSVEKVGFSGNVTLNLAPNREPIHHC